MVAPWDKPLQATRVATSPRIRSDIKCSTSSLAVLSQVSLVAGDGIMPTHAGHTVPISAPLGLHRPVLHQRNVVHCRARAHAKQQNGIASNHEEDLGERSEGEASPSQSRSIHTMNTEEWRAAYERDGFVDLWVEEEFNAGSRLMGGRDVHRGGQAGFRSGEGRSAGNVASHKVKIYNHYADQEVEVDVPEDRYVLWEAEEQGLLLPYACRMGCCTACAVRIKEGEMHQPQSLGVSQELREAGYALMCVGYPRSKLVLETVSEDEVYDLQFGKHFAELATNPNNSQHIERDDFAVEIANMDE